MFKFYQYLFNVLQNFKLSTYPSLRALCQKEVEIRSVKFPWQNLYPGESNIEIKNFDTISYKHLWSRIKYVTQEDQELISFVYRIINNKNTPRHVANSLRYQILHYKLYSKKFLSYGRNVIYSKIGGYKPLNVYTEMKN